MANRRFGWHSGSLNCYDLTIANDLTISGNMIFGDASADTLTVTGTATFGADSLWSTDKKVTFRAAANYINSPSTDNLKIASLAILLDGDVTVDGAHTLSTGTGAVSINGDATYATDKSAIFRAAANYINSPSAGNLEIASLAILMDGDVTIDGAHTLSTGTGAVSVNGDATYATDKSAIFRAAANYIQSPSADNLKIVSPTVEIESSAAILLDGDTTLHDAHTFGTGTGAVSLNGSTVLATTKTYTSGGAAAIGGIHIIYQDGAGAKSFEVIPGTSIDLAETNITLTGAIKLDGTVTLDDDGTIADASNVMTITQDSIELVGAVKLDGTITLDDDGTIADASDVMTVTQDTISLVGATAIDLDGNTTLNTGHTLTVNDTVIGMKEIVTIGLGGTVAINSFPFNEITQTEAAAAFAKVDDGGVFQNLATSATGGGFAANYQLFPDTELENDAAYFGAASPFGAIYTDVAATVATYGADSITWEYYNGSAWVALTILDDYTDSTAQDGLRPFQRDGYTVFSAPSDWASTTVDSQVAYWIRARCNATVNITQIPLLDSHEHYIITAPAASEMIVAGTIGRARINWDTVSTGTADTKIILCNLTSGVASAEKTLTKAKREGEVADFALVCAAGDAIAVYITQVDGGGAEYADGIAELVYVRS